MSKYLFRLEKMHINSQRNNVDDIPDYDIVAFGVEIGTQQYGPLKAHNYYPMYSGWDLFFGHFADPVHRSGFRRDANQVERGRWEIGPIDVADDDVAAVDYAVVNAYDSLSAAGSGGTSELTKQITFASFVALVGVGAAFAQVPGAVIAALLGGLATVVGFILGGPRNCDGVVGGNKKMFTGAELRKATNNPQQTFSITDTSGNSGNGCATSQIAMTFSCAYFPYYSMKQFLVEKSALALPLKWPAGFRDYTKRALSAVNESVLPSFYGGPSTSARFVIENWESEIIS